MFKTCEWLHRFHARVPVSIAGKFRVKLCHHKGSHTQRGCSATETEVESKHESSGRCSSGPGSLRPKSCLTTSVGVEMPASTTFFAGFVPVVSPLFSTGTFERASFKHPHLPFTWVFPSVATSFFARTAQHGMQMMKTAIFFDLRRLSARKTDVCLVH